MPTVTRCLIVLALLAWLPRTARASPSDTAPSRQTSHTEANKYRAWRNKVQGALIARADAKSLATAAALAAVGRGLKNDPGKPALEALELATQAIELAPQDAAIAWLRLSLCAEVPSCDIKGAATVMRWIDADNSAAWLPSLSNAQKDKDATDIDRVLADMARGTRFDLYWNRIAVLMFDALTRVRTALPRGYAASDSARFDIVSGIASGEIIPAFSPLVEICRESAAQSERRDSCLKLAKVMQHGDTIIAQLAGFSIERRLVAPDGKEARLIAERRHVLEWRVSEAAKIDAPMLPWTKGSRIRERLAHMRLLPREEDVCLAILRDHKAAIDPPETHP